MQISEKLSLTVFYDRFLNIQYFRMFSLHMHDICKYVEQTASCYKHIFEAISFLPDLKTEVIVHMVQSFYLTLFCITLLSVSSATSVIIVRASSS